MADATHKQEHAEKSLEKYTVKELRAMAAILPHERAIHDMKKEELVALIKETRGIKDGDRARNNKPAAGSLLTKPELKSRIRELKALKLEAREPKESRKTTALRHQIGRLKKRMRRLLAR